MITVTFDTPNGKLELKTGERQFLGYRGASFRSYLGKNEFLYFPMEERADHTMWMKDVYLPLDIIFIDNDTVVGTVQYAAPGQSLPLSCGKESTGVIEVNAGLCKRYNIGVGTSVDIKENF